MTSYLYQSPSGVPGDVSRTDESNIEPAFLITPFPSNYGTAMIYTPGGITPYAGGAASGVAGLLVRAVPGISQSSVNEVVNQFTPNQSEVQGLMVRGYAMVTVNAGVPVRGQPVYIVQTASAGHVVGQFETTSNGGNNIALSSTVEGNWTWATDGLDSFGNAEIRIAQ